MNTSDYTDITKAHPFLEIYVQVPTISTSSGNSNGTDNIGFFNPVLKQSLGDVEGFNYVIRGWSGNTAKWADLTIETGAVNNTNILYFLNNPGFILCYGVKDIVNGLNLSYSYPPVISFLKYTGETFEDGIISQGLTLPDKAVSNDKDLFIKTDDNTIHRFDGSYNSVDDKKWVQLGGSSSSSSATDTEGAEMFLQSNSKGDISLCENGGIFTIGKKVDNKLIVDNSSNFVPTEAGMTFNSNAFFLLKKKDSHTGWNLVVEREPDSNLWSGFRPHSWDCFKGSANKYKFSSTGDISGATMHLQWYSQGNISLCENGGRVGIGVFGPQGLLHVGVDSETNTNNTTPTLADMNSVSYLRKETTLGNHEDSSFAEVEHFDFANTSTNYNLSIYAEGMIFTSTYVGASDKRIKKNITEIDDERSLIQLRNLPCVDYEYIDNFKNGEYKTIGFIAQDVAEIMPNCVKKVSDIIPNEMRKLENVAWEEMKDDEGTMKYKLLNQNLEHCNYRFYVKKDASSNEISMELEYPFLFDKKYEEVFCYGKRVDDFLAIDKNKIFAVAFSATQQIDRIQQQHKIQIKNLEAENTTLKARLDAIEAKLISAGI